MEPLCDVQLFQPTSTNPYADLAEGSESGVHVQIVVRDTICSH